MTALRQPQIRQQMQRRVSAGYSPLHSSESVLAQLEIFSNEVLATSKKPLSNIQWRILERHRLCSTLLAQRRRLASEIQSPSPRSSLERHAFNSLCERHKHRRNDFHPGVPEVARWGIEDESRERDTKAFAEALRPRIELDNTLRDRVLILRQLRLLRVEEIRFECEILGAIGRRSCRICARQSAILIRHVDTFSKRQPRTAFADIDENNLPVVDNAMWSRSRCQTRALPPPRCVWDLLTSSRCARGQGDCSRGRPASKPALQRPPPPASVKVDRPRIRSLRTRVHFPHP